MRRSAGGAVLRRGEEAEHAGEVDDRRAAGEQSEPESPITSAAGVSAVLSIQ